MLKALQNELLDYLILQKENQALEYIVEHKLSAKQALNVYRHSLLGNHLGAMQEIYCVCLRLVGEAFFTFAFERFFSESKHAHYDISQFGEDFPEFLRGFPPAQSIPYLGDVAQLEWSCHLAALGERYPSFDFQALSKVSEKDQALLCFDLPPNSTLLASNYPILAIWQNNQPDAQEKIISLKEGGDYLLIWRQGLDLTIERLGEMDWFCLNHFLHRRPLSNLFYSLSNRYSLSEQACQNSFIQMLRRGWLVGFCVLQ